MKSFGKLAISLTQPKETALYFESVLPINLIFDLAESWGKYPDGTHKVSAYIEELHQSGMREELIPPELVQNQKFMDEYAEVFGSFYILILKALADAHGRQKPDWVEQQLWETINDSAPAQLKSLLSTYGLGTPPVDVSSAIVYPDGPEEGDPIVTLAGLQLIDAKLATWKQIVEFRRDKDSVNNLRRLRLFAYENYMGKDAAFIEDDILEKIASYERAVNKWGFSTKEGVINLFLHSKLLAGTSIASLGSIFLGAPLPAILASAGGIAIEIGKATLFYQKQKLALKDIVADNPVSYISDANKVLTGKC